MKEVLIGMSYTFEGETLHNMPSSLNVSMGNERAIFRISMMMIYFVVGPVYSAGVPSRTSRRFPHFFFVYPLAFCFRKNIVLALRKQRKGGLLPDVNFVI